MKFIFVVNGRPDKEPLYANLFEQLQQCKSPYEVYKTTGIGDATRFTRVYCDLHPSEEVCFVACGGDSIFCEVASGLVGFEHKELALMNHGASTANILVCYPDRDFLNVEKMLKGKTQPIDILRVNDSYALNMCDFGFDSLVISCANDLIAKGVKPHKAYNRGILRSTLTGRYNRISISADGKRIARRMLLTTLGNGMQVGGEFLCAPNAKPDDGLIELCLFKPMSLLRFLLIISYYRHGEHLHRPLARRKIIYRQVRHVEVDSKDLIMLSLDGELLPGAHFVIDILPKAIQLRLPALNNQ